LLLAHAKLAGLPNFVTAWPVVKVMQLRFAERQLICFKAYQMLSLLGPMQGRRVWVALAEPGVSYRSQPCLPAQGRQGWLQARRAGGNVSEV